MPHIPVPQQSLLQMADLMGRDQDSLARDLANRIFPQSVMHLTDRDVAEVRRCLVDWVRAIERALLPEGSMAEAAVFPQCWDTLAASSLLSDPALILEARVRAFLWEFAQCKDATPANASMASYSFSTPALLNQMACMDNPLLADAAMRLMSATLRDNTASPGQLTELPVELLHMLIWRVVAAHEIIMPGRQLELQARVPAILAAHDEGLSQSGSAQHLAHKMMELHLVDAARPALRPAQQGLALTLALLGLASGLSFIHIAQMAMEAGLARLCVLLRALGYDEAQAGALMGWIVGRRGHENAALGALSRYNSVSAEAAMTMVQQWRAMDSSKGFAS